MKILYLHTTGNLGGGERIALDVSEATRSERPDWQFVALLGADGPLREAYEAQGVTCHVEPLPEAVARLGDSGLKGVGGRVRLAARGAAALAPAAAYLGRLRRSVRNERPDLIHSNDMKAHALGAWAAPAGTPRLWLLQDYAGARAVMSRLLRRAAGPGLSVVGLSDSVTDDAARLLGPSVPVQTIYPGIDTERYSPGPGDGAALDRAAGLEPAPPGAVRIGLVATFAKWKGHETFLDAVRRLGAESPAIADACRFYVVGGPIYRSPGSQWTPEALREVAERLGVADRIAFTGHQPDPAAVMRSLDVVVHASVNPEPFGRVIAEGMACGKAVVAVDRGPGGPWSSGAAEIFDDGESALGYAAGDSAGLARALGRLVIDPDLRRRLGEAGRARVLERFDRRSLGRPWAEFYERSLVGRPHGLTDLAKEPR